MFADDPETALLSFYASLQGPFPRVSIQEFVALWEMSVLRFECERPDSLEAFPEFSTRVRGAFGRRLKELQPRKNWRGNVSPLPHDLLFQSVPGNQSQFAIAKPFTIRAWIENNRVIVELRLFGAAMNFLEDAQEAMVRALDGGIALRNHKSPYIRLKVLKVNENRQPLGLVEEGCGSLVLNFRSPVAIRRGGDHNFDARAILIGIQARLQRLGPWQSFDLSRDPELDEEIRSSTIDQSQLQQYSWVRYSKNSPNVAIPISGQLGKITVSGKLDKLVQYCNLAQATNVGSHAALGLGWFDLIIYPN